MGNKQQKAQDRKRKDPYLKKRRSFKINQYAKSKEIDVTPLPENVSSVSSIDFEGSYDGECSKTTSAKKIKIVNSDLNGQSTWFWMGIS